MQGRLLREVGSQMSWKVELDILDIRPTCKSNGKSIGTKHEAPPICLILNPNYQELDFPT